MRAARLSRGFGLVAILAFALAAFSVPTHAQLSSASPAFFSWLGERGWELVDCQQREETVGLLGEKDDVTRCYFRRVGTVAPEPAAAPADSSGGSTSAARVPN